jgi:hypothetical protein
VKCQELSIIEVASRIPEVNHGRIITNVHQSEWDMLVGLENGTVELREPD